jgi:hypothetical protein
MWDQPLYEFSVVSFRIVIIIVVGFLGYNFFKGRPSGYIVLAIFAFAYLFTFFMGREYLRENFQETSSSCSQVNNKVLSTNEIIFDNTNPPYETTPIQSVDDYEYNLVFQNENDREITKELRNKLMSQYPMHWTTQPASSTYFQKGLKETFQTQQIDMAGVDAMYKNVSGENVAPPDTDSVEISERQDLQTYKPKETKDLKTTYDIDDAYSIIKKIYDAKGLEAQVEHRKDTNIYEIVGVRKKGEKVLYEDELGDASASASTEAVSENQESVTVVPQAATDMLYDSDPFYNKQNPTRMGKWDYTKYTPELERMFAPTYPLSQWY